MLVMEFCDGSCGVHIESGDSCIEVIFGRHWVLLHFSMNLAFGLVVLHSLCLLAIAIPFDIHDALHGHALHACQKVFPRA